MKLVLRESLLFVPVTLVYRGVRLEIDDILVDTGSATTLLSIDAVAPLGIYPEATDIIRRIRGVGGVEYVFSRRVQPAERGVVRPRVVGMSRHLRFFVRRGDGDLPGCERS